ncbi:MAG: rod shape-determining protein MreC [Candidatus Cloacimonetes bacterium]|nr:rod shape-determining protein MreC [Candidatus Cloacimonadota bacterium]
MTKSYHLLIYLILGILLLAGSKEGRYRKADFLSKTIYYPFISSVNWVESQLELKNLNRHLHNELADSIIEQNLLRQELEFFRKQNINYTASGYEHVIADVVGESGVYGQKYFILDKGRMTGIKCNMPVLGTSGIIGKIVTVGQNYSLLLPVTHSQFKLGVMLDKNHLQGLLESDLSGKVYMNMIRLGSEISLGDTVVTSNLSRIFPAYYPVGTISVIRKTNDNVNISAEVKLFSEINALTTLIVLLYENKENFEEDLEIQDESDY